MEFKHEHCDDCYTAGTLNEGYCRLPKCDCHITTPNKEL
jgi:hypothetical protein